MGFRAHRNQELWATWCGPCREQSRIVEGLTEELTARAVDVLAVNQGEKEKLVRRFVRENPSHAPVLLDPWQKIASRLDLGELPALVLLDRGGTVVELRTGLTSREELLGMLEELEGELPED